MGLGASISQARSRACAIHDSRSRSGAANPNASVPDSNAFKTFLYVGYDMPETYAEICFSVKFRIFGHI